MRLTGTNVDVLQGPLPQVRSHPELWRQVTRFILRKPLGAVGGLLLLIFMVIAVFAPLLATHNPDLNNYRARIEAPSAQHWFGTVISGVTSIAASSMGRGSRCMLACFQLCWAPRLAL